jgi:ankyrin repeat protein/CRP-like cAMP-binding protein
MAFEGNFDAFFARNNGAGGLEELPTASSTRNLSPSRRIDSKTIRTVALWRKKISGQNMLTDERLKKWDSLMAALILFTATVTIYEISFLEIKFDAMFGINRFVDLCFFIDIILQFRRPYFIRKTNTWIYNQKRIAMHYIRGWFLIDVVSATPMDVVSLSIDNNSDTGNMNTFRVLKVLKALKLFRILKGYQAILMIAARLNIQHATVQICGFLLVVLLYIHWLGCIMHMVPDFEGTGCIDGISLNWVAISNLCNASRANRWMGSLELAFGTMGMGYGWIYPVTPLERFFCLLSMMIGGCLHAFAIGSFCTVLSTHDPATIEFNSKHDLLLRYMDENNFPAALKNRVKSYYAYTRKIIRDKTYTDLQSNMTPKLQFDVARHCHKRWLKDLPLFRASKRVEADAFIGAVAVKMLSIAYPPREVIFVKGEFALALYVITRGLVHCCDPDLGGARLNVSGFLFGEEILLKRGVRYDTACSLSYVNLLSLSRTDLEEILHMGGDAFESTQRNLQTTAVKLALRRAMKEIAVSNRIIKGFKRSQPIMRERVRVLYLRFLISRCRIGEASAKAAAEKEAAKAEKSKAAQAALQALAGPKAGKVKSNEMVYYREASLDMESSEDRRGSRANGLGRRPSEVEAEAKATASILSSTMARGGFDDEAASSDTPGRQRHRTVNLPSIRGAPESMTTAARRLSGMLQRGMRRALEDPSCSTPRNAEQEQSSMQQWQNKPDAELTPAEIAMRTLSRWTLPSAEMQAAAKAAEMCDGTPTKASAQVQKELNNISKKLESLSDLEKEHKYNFGSLMEACAQGNLKRVQQHQQAGIDVQQSDYDERSPIHVACSQGHLHIIRYLLDDCGVEVNPVDRFGRTPLFEARLCSNSTSVVEFLTAHGAKMPEKGGSGVHQLLDASADGDMSEVRKYFECGGDLMAVDYDLRSALHIACTGGHLPVIRFLLDNGVDPNALDAFGRSPLDECKQRGFDEIERILREATAVVECVGEKKTLAFLMEAAAVGNVDRIKQYKRIGGNLSRADYDDRTAMHVACARGRLEVVAFLVDAGAELAPVDRFGRTPYFEARHEGHEKIMNLLHDHGADKKTLPGDEGQSGSSGAPSGKNSMDKPPLPRDPHKQPPALEGGHEERMISLLERMERRLNALEEESQGGIRNSSLPSPTRRPSLAPVEILGYVKSGVLPRVNSKRMADHDGDHTHEMARHGMLNMSGRAHELRGHVERSEQQLNTDPTASAFGRAIRSNLSAT